MTRELILQGLDRLLSPKRLEHTLNVEASALRLAEQRDLAPERVRLAALLHDCAKDLTYEQMLALAVQSDADAHEQTSPALLHAPVSAYLAQSQFNIEDPEILQAIREHTTGNAPMSELSIVLCLADYIEPSRDFPGVERIRALAEKGHFMEALLQCTVRTTEYTMERQLPMHARTIHSYNWLLTQIHINDHPNQGEAGS